MISGGLFLALIASYLWYVRREPFPHGGTAFGIIYGVVALFLMLLLLFFGIRKRWYRSTFGKLENWLQSHIWLGIFSLFVILAHTGFRFQDKVAVALLVVISIVVLSGIVGALLYKTVPRVLTDVESNLTAAEISEQLNQMLRSMARIASGKSAPFQRIHAGLVREARPGFLAGWTLLFRSVRLRRSAEREADLSRLVGLVEPDEQQDLRQLLVISRQQNELRMRLLAQQRYRNILDFWLFIHIPFSLAMIVLLVAHIVAAFYYSRITF